MSSLTLELQPAVIRTSPVWAPLSVVAVAGGLLLTYFPISMLGSANVSLVVGGLAVGIIGAPIEYALSALACSFVLASSTGLKEPFELLRWVFLGGAAIVLPLRVFFRQVVPGARRLSRFIFLIALFVAGSLSTLAISVSQQMSALKLGALLCLFAIAWPAAGALVGAYGPSSGRKLALALLAYASLPLLLSILGLALGRGALLWGRFMGVMGNPNTYALLAVIALPICIGALVGSLRRQAILRVAAGFLVLALSYTLLISVSRSAMMGALAAGAFFCAAHTNRKIAALVVLATVGLATRVLVQPDFVPGVVRNYVFKHEVNNGQEDALSSRVAVWKAARTKFEQNPWLGLGFGVSSRAEAGWSLGINSGIHSAEMGSSFWGSLAEIGVIGSVPLFSGIVLLVLEAGFFTWRVKDPWLTALYMSLVALLINAVFEGWLLAPGNFPTIYFWILCFFFNALVCRFRPGSRKRSHFMPPEPREFPDELERLRRIYEDGATVPGN